MKQSASRARINHEALERPLQRDRLLKGLPPPRRLLLARPRQRPARVAPVPEVAHHGALSADDAAPDGGPVPAGDDGLQLARGGHVAGVGEPRELDARLGRDVGEAGDGAAAAADERLQQEVGRAAEAHEAGPRVGGGGGARRGRDAVQLARVAARQLAAGDVWVLRQLDDGVGSEVDAAGGGGEVVHEQRDRRRVPATSRKKSSTVRLPAACSGA